MFWNQWFPVNLSWIGGTSKYMTDEPSRVSNEFTWTQQRDPSITSILGEQVILNIYIKPGLKSEPLVNILKIYSNRKYFRIMLSDGNKNGKKNLVQHTFFFFFFLKCLLIVYSDKLSISLLLKEMSYVVTKKKCCLCSCSIFFFGTRSRSFSPCWQLAFLIFWPPL